ncbi:hypothetical protein V8E53_006269 [Lactarius tabidus]
MPPLQSSLITTGSEFLTTGAMSSLPSTSALILPSTATSSTKFETIFAVALKEYHRRTKCDIASHPLATQIHSCDSPSSIIAVLRTQVQPFDPSQIADEKFTRWLDPTVHVLYALSTSLGNDDDTILPFLNAILAAIGVVLQATKKDRAGQGSLVDLFGHIEQSFQRLGACLEVRPTATMTEIIAEIMVEVLSILGIVTKEAGQGRARKFLKKLVGKRDVEDAIKWLDKLTKELAQMAEAEVLTITRCNDDEVNDADNSMEVVQSKVHDIAHSSQQSGTKSVHKSPLGGGVPQYERRPARDKGKSTQQRVPSIANSRPLPWGLLPIASSTSSELHPEIRPTSVETARLPAVRHHNPRSPTSTLCQSQALENIKSRIVVVGKSGSGKSPLIKAVFNADVQATPESALGKTDINFELERISEDNRLLVVQCSELASQAEDSQRFQNIRDFISRHTDTSCSASERLHAVLICVPASDIIDGNIDEGVKEILQTLRTRNVPMILVLTKLDMVISDVLSKIASGDTQLARVRVLEILREMPAEIVSGEPNFADLVENVVVTTDGFLPGTRDRSAGIAVQGEKQRASAEQLVWSAALRVCRDIVIQASIEAGRNGYWRNLGSRVEFNDQTLKNCVNIIHVDLVEIWNLSDKDRYLLSDEFKAKMSHLVKDLAKSHSQESDSYLTKVGFAKWVDSVYDGRPENVRCLIGYIVNLMVILDAIFCTTSGDISREDVLLVMEQHVNSGHEKGIHRDIRGFVTVFADQFSVLPKDLILERIIDLIQKYCVPPAGTS